MSIAQEVAFLAKKNDGIFTELRRGGFLDQFGP